MIANVRRRAISCMALMVGLSGSAPKMIKVFCFFSSEKKGPCFLPLRGGLLS
jgi:hypothetical protein